MKPRNIALALALVVGCLGAEPAGAPASVPSGYTATTVISGLDNPTAVRFASDGRIFVGEQGGVIKEYDSLADTAPTTVADLRTQVFADSERGLMGMALDPSFPTRPYLYVFYTYDAPPGGTAPVYGTPGDDTDHCGHQQRATYCLTSGRLIRLTISGGSVATAQKTLVKGLCGESDSHSAGAIEFDAKGRLYAAAGDGATYRHADYGQIGKPRNPCGDPSGGSHLHLPTAQGGALRAQDLFLPGDPVGLDGSLIRINPDTGAGSAANPLASSQSGNARRIVAYGFRNPFRFAINPLTQDVMVGDVGWGTSEEIDTVRPNRMRNFGWPCYEGHHRQESYAGLAACHRLYRSGQETKPLYTYLHNRHVTPKDGCTVRFGSAISGLAFEQLGSFESRYRNALFFADVQRGCIWAMRAGSAFHRLPNPHRVSLFANHVGNPVDLEFGPGGDLYFVDVYNGTIVRIHGPK